MTLGEIRKGYEIGKSNRGSFIWHACEDCGQLQFRVNELEEVIKEKNFAD